MPNQFLLYQLLTSLSAAFTSTGFFPALVLMVGWILSKKEHTVSAALCAIGLRFCSRFQNFHRVLNRNYFDQSKLEKATFKNLDYLHEPELHWSLLGVVFILDDTLERRKGKAILEKTFCRDPIRSNKKNTVKAWGIRRHVLGIAVRPESAGSTTQFVPLITDGYYSLESCVANKIEYMDNIEIACNHMSIAVNEWRKVKGKDAPLVFCGDGAYSADEIVRLASSLNTTLVARTRADTVLYKNPETVEKRGRGRPKKYGERFQKIPDLIAKGEVKPEIRKIKNREGTVDQYEVAAIAGIRKNGKSPLLIRLIAVRRLDLSSWIYLISNDLTSDLGDLVEVYLARWGIEVFFEEFRQRFGFETQREHSPTAINRTMPLLIAAYSVVTIFGCIFFRNSPKGICKSAWYSKETRTFSDYLEEARRCVLNGLFKEDSPFSSILKKYDSSWTSSEVDRFHEALNQLCG